MSSGRHCQVHKRTIQLYPRIKKVCQLNANGVVMDITIKLSRAALSAVTVEYETRDDTALAGVDYTATSGSVVFAAGEVSKMVSVGVLNHDTTNARKFLLVVTPASGAAVRDSTAECVIEPGNANGPLIMLGLITNAYNNVNGRGDYFHYKSGTSEGQFIAIEGALRAAKVMMAGDTDDQYAAEWMRLLGITLVNGLGSGALTGPVIRQPFPSSEDTIFLPHWLFAAKGDVPRQNGKFDYTSNVENGKIVIPRKDIFNVWKIYPADAALLYQSPYSPAYDSSGNDVGLPITDWRVVGNNTEITIPAGAPANAQWKVMFGYNSGTIKQGQGLEAYPFWTSIPDGYAAAAPDTFRWLELALVRYMAIDSDSKWATLRNAAKKSAIKGQNVQGQIEYMHATARGGDVITVERAQENTAPRTFDAGDVVFLPLTTAAIYELQGNGTGVHVSVDDAKVIV